MKTSLTHLPHNKREELQNLTTAILEELQGCEMIILYGSYARGNYVELNLRDDYEEHTTFRSDFDILVLTTNDLTHRKGNIIEHKLSKAKKKHEKIYHHVPVHFLNLGIDTMNKYLSDNRYFYTDIKREGIMLYDSKKFKLARRRKLCFDEIKEMAQEYYDEWFYRGCNFYKGSGFYYELKDYKLAAFMLHQSCESLISTINMVFKLNKPKEHDLEELINTTKEHTQKIFYTFRRETEEEKRLFSLLKAAYIQARYNSKFKVCAEDLDTLYPIVEQLKEVTETVCLAQLKYYEEKGS